MAVEIFKRALSEICTKLSHILEGRSGLRARRDVVLSGLTGPAELRVACSVSALCILRR